MNFRQISSFIAGPAGFIILLFFFLPWITVSCSGQDLIEASGLDLAQGVDDNDVQVDAADFGFDESMFEDIETEGDFQFDESEAFSEPLISVEDGGVEAGFLDGSSDAKLYFLPLIGMIALAVVAGTYFEPRLLNPYTAAGGYILPAGIGLLIMLLKYLEISGDMSDIEQQAIEESGFNIVQLEYQFGWWLTILGLLALFAAGVVAFLFGEQQPALAVADTEKELMLRARSLIEAKQYDEARQLLKIMKNPTAQQWLQKLDELDPFGDPFKEVQE